MNVAVEDLHTVIESAKGLGGKVVLAGHSLGGSVVTAYATWDFAGSPGADGLSGLVYDDGGSGPTPITQGTGRRSADQTPEASRRGSPSAGSASPFLGLFSTLGAMGVITGARTKPRWPRRFPLLPSNLKPNNEKGELIPVTNEAEFGFGVNVGSSPPNLPPRRCTPAPASAKRPTKTGSSRWNGEGAHLAAAPLRGNARGHRLQPRRRRRVVLPRTAHDRHRRGRRRQREPGAGSAGRARDPRPRTAGVAEDPGDQHRTGQTVRRRQRADGGRSAGRTVGDPGRKT